MEHRRRVRCVWLAAVLGVIVAVLVFGFDIGGSGGGIAVPPLLEDTTVSPKVHHTSSHVEPTTKVALSSELTTRGGMATNPAVAHQSPTISKRSVDADSAAERMRDGLYWKGGKLKAPIDGEVAPPGVWEVAEAQRLPKDICGREALRLLNLSFTSTPINPLQANLSTSSRNVSGSSVTTSSTSSLWGVVVSSNRPYHSDIQLSARMILNVATTTPPSLHSRILISPVIKHLPTDGYLGDRWLVSFRLPSTILRTYCGGGGGGDMKSRAIEVMVVEADVMVTWIGTKFLGQKWSLPNRNDNPPFAEMKRKCLDLTLSGECDRFGVSVASLGDKQLHITCPSITTTSTTPPTGTFHLSSEHFWRAVDSGSSANSDELSVVDDPVGLNRLMNTSWIWEAPTSHTSAYPTSAFPTKAVAAERLIHSWLSRATSSLRQCDSSPITTITTLKQLKAAHQQQHATTSDAPFIFRLHLLGDSMLVEQFYIWAGILGVPHGNIRNGKGGGGLRWMQYSSDVFTIQGTSVRVDVRFVRGYTTSSGKSVIAPHARLLSEITQYNAPVVLTNLASLHWQQNMKAFSEWSESVISFKDRLNTTSAKKGGTATVASSVVASLPQLVVFWGATQVQMGRTQGLNPSRTKAFNNVARAVFGPLDAIKTTHRSESCTTRSVTIITAYYDPLPLSLARRESSFDGQHWACYHRYGGVSTSIALQFLNELSSSTNLGSTVQATMPQIEEPPLPLLN